MTDALTDGLVDGIPLEEAAGFFVEMKTASAVPAVELDAGAEKTAASNLQRKIAELVAGQMPEGKAGHNKDVPPIDVNEKTASIRPPGLTDRQWVAEFYGNREKYAESALDDAIVGGAKGMALGLGAGMALGTIGAIANAVSKKKLPPGSMSPFEGVAGMGALGGFGGSLTGVIRGANKRASEKTAATLGSRLREIEGREKKKLTRVHRESGALRHGAGGAGAGAAVGAGIGALLKKPKRGAQIGAALGGAGGAAVGGLKGQKKGKRVSENIAKMRRKGIVESALRRRGARHALRDRDVKQLQALGYSVRTRGMNKGAGVKLAEGPGGLQQDPQQEAAPAQQTPQPAQQPQAQPQAPAAPQSQPMMPTNYLNAEMAARQAQQQNEAGYYRALLEQVQAENQASQAQVQELGAQMQELQQQSQQTGMHIEQATQQAVEAQDRATEHSQQAANMRMGMQRMREQMMQIASQDPDTFAPMQPEPAPMDQLNTPMDAQGGQPQPGAQQSAQAGQPDQAAEPGGGTPPGSASPQESGADKKPEAKSSGESASPKKDDSAKTQVQVKTSSPMATLGGAALGGLAGAAEGASMGNQVPGLEQKVEQMAGQTGGFARAMRFAQAKAKLEMARAAQEDPTAAALKGGAMGALAGAGLGAAGSRMAQNLKTLMPGG